MLEKHVTREGNELLIAEMSNEHLVNFVNMLLNRASAVKNQSMTIPQNNYTRKLYGLREVSEEQAAMEVREIIRKLYPYLAELYLRGIDTTRELLAKVLEREQVVQFQLQPIHEQAPY